MKTIPRATIKKAMKKFVGDCKDPITGEVNFTLLAEQTANDLNYYKDQIDYEIPEEVFEIALDFE